MVARFPRVRTDIDRRAVVIVASVAVPEAPLAIIGQLAQIGEILQPPGVVGPGSGEQGIGELPVELGNG